MTWCDESLTMDDIKKLWEKCKPPPGPRIDERTKLFAGLDCFALYGDQIKEIERQTKKDVLWNAAFDDWDEGNVVIFNPPEYEQVPLEMKPSFGRPTDFLIDRFTGHCLEWKR